MPAPAETVWHALTDEREYRRWFGRKYTGLTSVLSTRGIDSPAAGKHSATITIGDIADLLFD